MKMIPSYCDLPDNVYTSSVKYNRIDTEGNNHNIELGIDTIVLSIKSFSKKSLLRGTTVLLKH